MHYSIYQEIHVPKECECRPNMASVLHYGSVLRRWKRIHIPFDLFLQGTHSDGECRGLLWQNREHNLVIHQAIVN